jgi:hypothetical protein
MTRFYEPDLSVDANSPFRERRFKQACSAELLDGHD